MEHRRLIFHEDSVQAVIWKMILSATESNWKVNRSTCGKRPVCYQNFFSDGWWKALGTRRRSVSHASLPSHWAADGRHESERIREMEVLRARVK